MKMDPGVIKKETKKIKTMIADQALPLLGIYKTKPKKRLYKSIHSSFIYYNLKLK